MNEIRKLRADEIDVRVGSTNKQGTKAMLLLYKDARCDMAVLDEVFGIGNWQSEYREIKGVLYCKVGVRASSTAKGNETPLPNDSWVWKESNGVESQGTGADDPNNQKGEASDAFKRACFMWGIGRELYEWKNLWIDHDKEKDKYERYSILTITYASNGNPKDLTIVNSKGDVVYKLENGYFKAVTSVSNEKVDKNTSKQEKVVTSENTMPKREFELSKEPEEDLETLVEENNRVILKQIMLKVKEIGDNNQQSMDDIKRVAREGILNYFEKALKFPIVNGKPSKLELASVEREPLIKGNIVVVYNEKFIKDFTKYILDNEFMPF